MEERLYDLLDKINNYEQTINAIICFSHVLRWEEVDGERSFRPNSYYSIGRRMDTSPSNRINPENKVTPDLIVELNENYGIVCEVKKSLPRNRAYWNKTINQLIKYDDDLKGWITENEYIQRSDVVFLIHNDIKVFVFDYLNNRININRDLNFNRSFATIAFYRVDQRKTWINFEKGFGNLSDRNLDEKFRLIWKVPLEEVRPLNPTKFYDAKPEVSYTMSILWIDTFSQYPRQEEFMEAEGRKIITIRINIEELVNRMKNQFFPSLIENDPRQQKVPKSRWVKEAMKMFVRLNYAYKEQDLEDVYIVKYKRIVKPLETFTREVLEVPRMGIRRLNDFI